jgi:hypothetical protein
VGILWFRVSGWVVHTYSTQTSGPLNSMREGLLGPVLRFIMKKEKKKQREHPQRCLVPSRGTSLIRNRPLVEPCSRTLSSA